MIKHNIVLVQFPFDDFSGSKLRPALCLTNFVGAYNHVVVAFISSKIPKKTLDTDYLITKQLQNISGTGLKIDSVIKLHKMVTITENLIKRKLGKLGWADSTEVTKCLLSLFS